MMNVSNIGLKSFEEKLIIYRNFVKILSLGELAIVKTKIVRKKRPACTRLQARVSTILVATPLWRPSGWWIGPHSGGPGGFEASSRPQELALNSSMASKIRGTAPINNFVWFTQQRRGFDWTAAKTNQCVSRIAKSLITAIFASQRRRGACFPNCKKGFDAMKHQFQLSRFYHVLELKLLMGRIGTLRAPVINH
jgi:hypothetical protein